MRKTTGMVIAAIAAFATPAAAAYVDPNAHLMACEIVGSGGRDGEDRRHADGSVGEIFVLGWHPETETLGILHSGGAAPRWECKAEGRNRVCHFQTINRDAVFDTASGRLTMPFGFGDAYTEATCDELKLSR